MSRLLAYILWLKSGKTCFKCHENDGTVRYRKFTSRVLNHPGFYFCDTRDVLFKSRWLEGGINDFEDFIDDKPR